MNEERLAMRSYTRSTVFLLIAILLTACGRPADAPPESDVAHADTAALPDTAVAGFDTPESVLYDEAADLYLVSNINGDPFGKDDNGYIARVRPDGTIEQQTWIDGAQANVTLNAPKGLAIRGDSLFVSDIDSIRVFNRTSGAPLGAIGVPGATFLNDLAVGPDGTLYVSDTGMNPGFQPSGTDAIYRIANGGAARVAAGAALSAPNGLAFDDQGLVMVPFGASTVSRVAQDGSLSTLATLPAGQLDGVVRTADGALLVSSWEGKAVYRVHANGHAEAIVNDVESPADLGYDSRRNRVLIPLFMQGRVLLRRVP